MRGFLDELLEAKTDESRFCQDLMLLIRRFSRLCYNIAWLLSELALIELKALKDVIGQAVNLFVRDALGLRI